MSNILAFPDIVVIIPARGVAACFSFSAAHGLKDAFGKVKRDCAFNYRPCPLVSLCRHNGGGREGRPGRRFALGGRLFPLAVYLPKAANTSAFTLSTGRVPSTLMYFGARLPVWLP